MAQYDSYKTSLSGWFDKLPSHWDETKIKYFCLDIVNGATPSTANDNYWDGDIAWIASGKCHDCTIFSESKFITHEGLENSSTKLIPADTALVALTGATCAQSGYLAIEACTNQSVVAYIQHPNKLSAKFVFYMVQGNRAQYLTHQTGGAQAGINVEDCKNIIALIPPLNEQIAIAEYLDRKCGSIDAIIGTQEQRIELLTELKQSVITDAVTRGINPNVQLKDSGIDWIGQIPQHWTDIPLKFTGSFGNGLTYSPEDVCEEGGVLVLRSSNIQDDKLNFNETLYVKKCPTFLMVQPGDIIICSRNGSASLVGKCAIVEKDIHATFGAFMMRYRPYTNSKYGFYLLQAALKMYKGFYSTTTINQLTMGVISQIHVAIPKDKNEQEAIVAYLDKTCARIDSTIVKAKREIELLREYKQTIITDAVTGKIKVC